MDFLFSAMDAANGVAGFGWDVLATMDRTLLGISLGAAIVIALGCVIALGPVPNALRFYTAIFMFLFAFAGAVTLVELGPVLFDPSDLARSQVTPETID